MDHTNGRKAAAPSSLVVPPPPEPGELRTQLERTEQDLQRTRTVLAALQDSVTDAVLIQDRAGNVVHANDHAARELGFPSSRVLLRSPPGNVWRNLVVMDELGHPLPEGSAPWEQALRGAGTDGVLLRLRRRDTGADSWAQVTTTPVLDRSGAVDLVVTTTQDVTELHEADEAVHLSQQRLSLIYNTVSDGVILLGVEDPSTFRFLMVNAPFLRRFGLQEAEVMGKLLGEILPEGERDVWLNRCKETVRQLKEMEWESTLTVGTRTWHSENHLTPITNVDGACTHVLMVSRDITDRRQAEDALKRSEEHLRHSQKMEAVGRLAGGISHDFNNLLTAINGNTELLLEVENLGEEVRAGLNEIRKAGERAASLTQQLLAFSRKQVLVPKVLDLNTVVVDMERMLRRVIGEDVELATRLTQQSARIKADSGQVEQIILNVALNARDVMPRGGQLTVETDVVTLGAAAEGVYLSAPPGRYVLLAIRDTGWGMGDEIKAHLFEPFFTTKEKSKGTGLGLSIVYALMKQSGGAIHVESQPRQGSTFRMYFPLAERGESARPQPMTPARRAVGGMETILLVEDDEGVRRLATRILRANGYTVMEAASGGEALQLHERHRGNIELLLTDVVMPAMSGRELIERLKPLRPGMKVLFMSGYADDTVGLHGVAESGAALVGKPFTPRVLLDKVREVLGEPPHLRLV